MLEFSLRNIRKVFCFKQLPMMPAILTLISVFLLVSPVVAKEDPRLWLEEIDSSRALQWVREQNDVSVARLASSESFMALRDRLLTIYNSEEKIPLVNKRGEFVYNFWKDADHVQGLWRRTTLDSYMTDTPEWESILDLDVLSRKEQETWVWKGVDCLFPDYGRCVIRLSRGGADATVTREFDVETRQFIEDGFVLSEAKSDVGWIDIDTVYVGTDFGEGTLTDSGYPRIVKRWRRGKPLSEAKTVYEGEVTDIAVAASHDHTPGWEGDFVTRVITFFSNEVFEITDKGLWKIPKQDDARVRIDKGRIFFELRSDWNVAGKTFSQGSLIVSDYKEFKKDKAVFEVLFAPDDSTSLQDWATTKDHVVMNVLDDVRNRIKVLTPGTSGWKHSSVEGLPDSAQVSAWPVDNIENNQLWFEVQGYLTPSSLWLGEVNAKPKLLKKTPEWFDTKSLAVTQNFATSKDGTRIPYFLVSKKDQNNAQKAPTLLYGYGGFEHSELPSYSGSIGVGWLERGGNFAVANIRGGGEYGPRWHQAALKSHRNRAFEDFAAVATDLVKRGITSRNKLGIWGGSNGGLLVGNMYTQYPELFGAVVSQVPLLDMKRYTKLLAGASWMGEYGNPDDPEQWSYIKTFSPYHNIDKNKDYPPILLTTSTRDDRVHPGHARKFVHALKDAGKDVLYYENIEGGHGGAANNKQSAFMRAIIYEYFWEVLTSNIAVGKANGPAE